MGNVITLERTGTYDHKIKEPSSEKTDRTLHWQKISRLSSNWPFEPSVCNKCFTQTLSSHSQCWKRRHGFLQDINRLDWGGPVNDTDRHRRSAAEKCFQMKRSEIFNAKQFSVLFARSLQRRTHSFEKTTRWVKNNDLGGNLLEWIQ